MSEPSDDQLWQDYLHRKSALSMGYRRVYVEAPPPELDRTITARARRALKLLVPGLVAVALGLGMIISVNVGVTKYMNTMVKAQKNVERLNAERKQQEEEQRAKEPVSVIIDSTMLKSDAPVNTLSRDAWRAKIVALKNAGRQTEADEETKKLRAAYPDEK